MSDNVNETFPTTYQEWRHCIEDLGQISLTRAFIDKRLTELQDSKNANTEEFANLYGDDRLHATIGWFQQAASELSD